MKNNNSAIYVGFLLYVTTLNLLECYKMAVLLSSSTLNILIMVLKLRCNKEIHFCSYIPKILKTNT